VPLCLKCHGKVHDSDMVTKKRLQAIGIAAAKARGVYIGRKPGTTKRKPVEARELRDKGMSAPDIATQLDISERTVWRYLR